MASVMKQTLNPAPIRGSNDECAPTFVDVADCATTRGKDADFWKRVEKTETCWIWKSSINSTGYGQYKSPLYQPKPVVAHRVAFLLSGGQIPDGYELDHLCRNRRCVRPDHMEPVTHAVNMQRGLQGMKAHCPQGHAYEGENLIVYRGRRYCRACQTAYKHRHDQRRPDRGHRKAVAS